MLRMVKQPFSKIRLGDYLNSNLQNKKWIQFDAAIAFVKKSGIKYIFDSLQTFAKSQPVNIAVGVDLGGTSIEGLNMLRLAVEPAGQISVIHSGGASTFHPKIYCFRNEKNAELIIGSGNLTAGGLYSNFEGCVVVTLDLEKYEDQEFLADLDLLLDSWCGVGAAIVKTLDDTLMIELKESGYIVPEALMRVSPAHGKNEESSEGSEDKKRAPLFGSATIPSLPPSTSGERSPAESKKTKSTVKAKPKSSASPTKKKQKTTIKLGSMWIETRKMTGGSRNILDLSKQGKRDGVLKFGSVTFFGIEPDNVTKSKTINIHYDGQVYKNNSIFFAEDNSNWRIQLKGQTMSGDRLTAIPVPGRFVDKVLVFTKIDNTNYEMTILGADKMDELKDSSSDWAKGGKGGRGRAYGII